VGVGAQQITDILHVYLELGAAHELGDVLVLLVDEVEYVHEGAWDDAHVFGRGALALHGVGLATAGLALCENGAVVAAEH